MWFKSGRYVCMTLRLVLCLVAAIALCQAGCSKRSEGGSRPGGRGGGAPAVPVRLAKAEQKTTAIEVASFGTVEALANVDIKAQVSGILTGVHFTEGQMVKKGDLLLSIDPREREVALKVAQANLAGHEAQLKNAESETTRQTELLEKGFTSQDEYDKATTAVEMLRASVSADKAAIENATLLLDYCSIRSPWTVAPGACTCTRAT